MINEVSLNSAGEYFVRRGWKMFLLKSMFFGFLIKQNNAAFSVFALQSTLSILSANKLYNLRYE